MGKKIKMALYGEPGVGKSTFALGAPKPFFICTDGNYEWLEEFGADMDAHENVSSWSDAKAIFQSNKLNDYETIVVDLTEDLFKWCEKEYCVRNKIEHVSDHGYGKGYDCTRNDFFIELCKLISLDKHILLIMHGITGTKKDRRGVEHTFYAPSSRLPDKLIDMIEGRMRYFLRCYLKGEETDDGVLVKRRYLSLIPKENEFGIARGIDESKVPHDIPLSFDIFAKYINLYSSNESEPEVAPMIEETPKPKRERKQKVEAAEIHETVKEHFAEVGEKAVETLTKLESKQEAEVITTAESLTPSNDAKERLRLKMEEIKAKKAAAETSVEPATEHEKVESVDTAPWEEPVKVETKTEPIKTETKVETKVEEKAQSNADKIAAIKAKLAASRAANK